MRTFEHPNFSGDWVCPICGTAEDKPIVLIPIQGTQKGNNCQAEQYHEHCIDPVEITSLEGTTYLVQEAPFKKKCVCDV